MVGSVGYRDSKGGAKAHAVFCSLNSNPVVTIVCHVTHLNCRNVHFARALLCDLMG